MQKPPGLTVGQDAQPPAYAASPSYVAPPQPTEAWASVPGPPPPGCSGWSYAGYPPPPPAYWQQPAYYEAPPTALGPQQACQQGLPSQYQQQQQVVVVNGGGVQRVAYAENFCSQMICACFVTWCCNCLFGTIAFFMAVYASCEAVTNPRTAHCCGKASWAVSTVGVIVAIVVTVVTVAIVVSSAAAAVADTQRSPVYNRYTGSSYNYGTTTTAWPWQLP